MAAIDRNQLLADEKVWLPEGNVLTDAFMMSINEFVIGQLPADDTIHYPEALCKGLRAIANANKVKYEVDTKGIRREEVGDVETEYFEATTIDPWGNFIKSLTDICPIFGYTGLKLGIGMTISPSDAFVIDNGPNSGDLVTLDIDCPTTFIDTDDNFL